MPHLVDLHDVVGGCGRRRRRVLAGRADPLVDRDVADPEELGDHALADVAERVEQHRQRLHRRRLAARRRRREVAAARLAAVALVAGRHAVPDERRAPAMLAGQIGHDAPSRPRTKPGKVGAISQKLSVSARERTGDPPPGAASPEAIVSLPAAVGSSTCTRYRVRADLDEADPRVAALRARHEDRHGGVSPPRSRAREDAGGPRRDRGSGTTFGGGSGRHVPCRPGLSGDGASG